MKTWIGIGLLAMRASWKWLLALFVVVVLVAAGFMARGILLEDSEAKAAINVETPEPAMVPEATSVPKPAPSQAPKATTAPRPRVDVVVAPTAVVAPTPAPTRPPATPTVAPPPPTAAAPASVDVPIHLTGAANVGSLEFVLVYDPEVLQVANVAPGALANSAVIGSNAVAPGRVWVGVADARGIDGSGAVATVTFDVVGRQKGSSPLTLEQIAAHDATSLLDILSDATAGEYTPLPVFPAQAGNPPGAGVSGHEVTGPNLVFTR